MHSVDHLKKFLLEREQKWILLLRERDEQIRDLSNRHLEESLKILSETTLEPDQSKPTKIRNDVVELRSATDKTIDKVIGEVYDDADKLGTKPPNIRELVPFVQSKLRSAHSSASGRRIQQIAERYRHRRRKPGVTIASEVRSKRR